MLSFIAIPLVIYFVVFDTNNPWGHTTEYTYEHFNKTEKYLFLLVGKKNKYSVKNPLKFNYNKTPLF